MLGLMGHEHNVCRQTLQIMVVVGRDFEIECKFRHFNFRSNVLQLKQFKKKKKQKKAEMHDHSWLTQSVIYCSVCLKSFDKTLKQTS